MLEGIGDEVFYFGVATIVCGALLARLLLYIVGMREAQPGDTSRRAMEPAQGRTRTSDPDCAICLGSVSLAVETNCGHVYCGQCILEVWRRSGALQAALCPYCRQRLTLMLPYFSQEERDSADLELIDRREKTLSEVLQYNRRHSGEPRSLMEQLYDLPMLLRHLLLYIFSGEGLHLAFQLRVAVLACFWLLYFVSPLDLIPEALFGLVGLLDDLVIFLLVSMYLTFFFRQVITNIPRQPTANDVPGVNQ